MFKSALDLIKQGSAKRGAGGFRADPSRENGLFFATHASGKMPFVFFRIGRELARKAGLAIGDTVIFEWDEGTGKGRISSNPKGWKLVSGNTKSDEPPLILRVTWRKGYPSIAEPAMCSDVIAKARSITFTYPEGVSYGELAKKMERKDEEKAKTEEPDPLYEEHKKIAEREEKINKKARKDLKNGECCKAPFMKDGKPYGRRATDR